MIADLLDKLIDRLIQLKQERKSGNREHYTDFIEPAFEQFCRVHAEYLEALRRYRERTDESQFTLGGLIDQIHSDLMFTETQRGRLRQMAFSYIEAVGERGRMFYDLLLDYVVHASHRFNRREFWYEPVDDPRYTQPTLGSAARSMQKWKDELSNPDDLEASQRARRHAREVIDDALRKLLAKHEMICRVHEDLRAKLLG